MTDAMTRDWRSRRDFLFPSQGTDDPDATPSATPTSYEIADSCLTKSATDCRLCDDVCEPRALRFRPAMGGIYVPSIDAEQCTACGECVPMCPVNAIVAGVAA